MPTFTSEAPAQRVTHERQRHFPTGCCGSVPWMEVDRLPADYDARVAGPKVDRVLLIESSVGVTPGRRG